MLIKLFSIIILSGLSFASLAQKYIPYSRELLTRMIDLEKQSHSTYFSIQVLLNGENRGCKLYLYSSFSDLYKALYSKMEYNDFVDSMNKMVANNIPINLTNRDTTGLQIIRVCDYELSERNSDQLIDSIFESTRLIKERYFEPPKEIIKSLVILSQRRFSLAQEHRNGLLVIGYSNIKEEN